MEGNYNALTDTMVSTNFAWQVSRLIIF